MSDKIKVSKEPVPVPGGTIVGPDLRAREGFVLFPDDTVILGSWPLGQAEPLSIVAYLVATTTEKATVFLAEVWFIGDRLGRACYGAYRIEVPGGTWSGDDREDLKRGLHERLFHPRVKAR